MHGPRTGSELSGKTLGSQRSVLESVVEMDFFNGVYNGETVLVTGHTGFKGSWLSIWLHELGAKVVGYSLDPYTEKDNFVLSDIGSKIIDIRGDIRDKQKLNSVFKEYQPKYVFHLAAQSLVRFSYTEPVETYEINVMGTINLLEEIRKCDATKIGIMITTDKCYENKEQLLGYRESDSLGGYDPYSSSKGAAEIAINSWRLSFMNPMNYHKHGKAIASARAGNVIGGGDWAKDRIVPDCIRAIEGNMPIELRAPLSVRPWEHVLEPLCGYLLLGAKMCNDPVNYSEAWNFGPENDVHYSVYDIAKLIVDYSKKGKLINSSGSEVLHESNLLLLNIDKAKSRLGWSPVLNIEETVKLTVDWYLHYQLEDVYNLCVNQINSFTARFSNE